MQTLNLRMTNSTGMLEWIKSIGENLIVFTAPIFYLIWKASETYQKRVEAQSKKDRDFVTQVAKEVSKTVVKEILDSVLPDIHENIQDIKKETHNINKRIDEIYKK